MTRVTRQIGVAATTVTPVVTFEPGALAASAGGRLLRAGSAPVAGGAVDSRRVEPGNVFFALPGERTDGHVFLGAAVAAGAAALIISQPQSDERLDELARSGEVSIIEVSDSGKALRDVAARYRDRFAPLIVGITGSIAKTSTKELTAAVLDERFEVLRSAGNENNEVGLPLTLLRLRPEHQAAVLEMGLYMTGEIALLADIARPSIGVVTAVRGVHLARAGSIEAIEAGKRELVEALPPDGFAVLNVDDARVAGMAGHTRARVLGYGFAPDAQVRAEEVTSRGASGMSFQLCLPAGRVAVSMPTLGRHGVHNALAAAAVAACAGLSPEEIARGLAHEISLPHRSQLHRLGGWTILDDSYNASPDAVLAALDLLAGLPGRRFAVLGEMLELGDPAEAEHHRVGHHAAGIVDWLVVVGAGAAGIADGALEAGLDADRVALVADRDAALALLLAELRPGDTILVKASRGAALDLLVAQLLRAAEPGEAGA